MLSIGTPFLGLGGVVPHVMKPAPPPLEEEEVSDAGFSNLPLS